MRRSLLAAVIAATFFAPRASAADPPWFEVRSPNFTVYTDAGEKRGREVALRFEQMRAIFGQLFQGKARVEVGVPLKIVAFRNSKGMRQVAPVYDGKSVELGGMFQPGDGVTFIALDLSSYNPWEVVFHEYGHMLLNANEFNAPLWFDEGFAEYYSTVRVDKKEYSLGLVPERVPYTLNQSRFLTVTDLFSVQHESPIYNKGDHRSVFYAQSWLAVHYLRSTAEMAEKLRNYLRLHEQRTPVPEAIRAAFGDAKQLDKDLEKHFRMGQAMVYRIKLPPGLEDVAMQTRPLEALDARAIVAEFRLQSRHHQEAAVADFRTILSQSPDHAIALRGLGYALLRQGEWEEAGEYFRRAAAQDSNDPRVHYLSALLVQRSGLRGAEGRAQMRKSLERALELDPNYADAHGMLGMSYALDNEMPKAIPAIRRALELKPREDGWAMNLANCYVATQEWDKATELLQRLAQNPQSRVASNAARLLETVNRLRSYAGPVVVSTRLEGEPNAIRGAAGETAGPPSRQAEDTSAPPVTPAPAPVASTAASEPPPMANVMRFFRGTLLKVECGPKNSAVFSIRGGQRDFVISAPNLATVSFSGKRRFACDWKDLPVKGFFVSHPEKGYLMEAIEVE